MFKLSVSNIAWSAEHDTEMYPYLKKVGYQGLEIAPTRIYPELPYEKVIEAKIWAEGLKKEYGLVISSMQSIWYGRQEKIFGSIEERSFLVDYTKKAIDFAEAIGCHNLVFGNPRNRDVEDAINKYPYVLDFFREIGDYALEHHTIIAIEPNPIIYNTRFINYTEQAVELAYLSKSEGIKVNVDLGTLIYNKEDVNYLKQIPEYVNHVHISEPFLNLIEQRELHRQLFAVLKEMDYSRFVSIEMGNKNNLQAVKDIINYVIGIRHEI